MQQYFGLKKENKTLFLNPNDENHIKNVMRYKHGDKVFVVFESTMYLCELSNDLLKANIIEEVDTKREQEIYAFIPVLQEEKMKFVLEKGTELGVTKFIPVNFERCKYHLDKKGEEKKLVRWSKICKEASEQSRRFIVPSVSNILSVENIETSLDVNILCSLDKENVKHISKVLNTNNVYGTISLIFGPEGGITSKEEDILVSKGFIRTSLGETTLRTETVIVSLLSIINYLKGSDL